MYSRRFFASQLGFSALLSIAAMVSFNLYAAGQQLGLAAASPAIAAPLVDLA